MSAVGRNDPCPCGSGQKYKKCCLGKAAAASGVYTDAERESALIALGRFGGRHEFDGERAAAEARFWSDEMLDLVPERDRWEVVEQGQVFFQDWFTLDFRLGTGQTIVELFLQREGRRLRSGELRYLERARLTHLRPYEVVGVRLDEGLDLVDLWTRKRVQLRERLATHQVVQGDVLAARLTLGPEGALVLDGAPYRYPARMKAQIVKDLRSTHRKFRRQVPGDDADFFKRLGCVFFAFWLQHAIARSRLQVRSVEGDEIVIAKAVFDITDRPALERALDGHPDLVEQDDGSYAWHEPGGDEEFRRGLGAFVVEDDRVVLETMSKPRAERGRAFLEALAGASVRYRATSFEGLERAMARHSATLARPQGELPAEVKEEVIRRFYDKHYRDWVDQPLPAFGGKTPREAVRTKAGRSQVRALLKEMEVMAARDRREGRPAYDFTWMWAELGLERPG